MNDEYGVLLGLLTIRSEWANNTRLEWYFLYYAEPHKVGGMIGLVGGIMVIVMILWVGQLAGMLEKREIRSGSVS